MAFQEVDTYGHTFKVLRKNAGFLWLGAEIAVVENREIIDKAVVYGDTLHAMQMHMDAEVDLALGIFNLGEVVETNRKLPKCIQRPHPSVQVT